MRDTYQICDRGWVTKRLPGDEDQDSTNEKDAAEALKEVAKPGADYMRFRGRWFVSAIFLNSSFDLLYRKTGRGRGGEPLNDIVGVDGVPFKVAKVCTRVLA